MCNGLVTEKSKAVGCDACLDWYHIKCLNYTLEKYKMLLDENVSWYCTPCKGAAKALRNQMITMKVEMDQMKGRIDNIEKNQLTEEKVNNIIEKKMEEMKVCTEGSQESGSKGGGGNASCSSKTDRNTSKRDAV